MSKKENKENSEVEIDSELDNLKKLGIIFDTLEEKALEFEKKELESQKDTIIEKAKKQKDKEKIQEVQETTDDLENINAELVGALYIPIDLFINEGFENKGITPISEIEIEKLLELLFKLLPTEIFEKITETMKLTKKLDWVKNLTKGIALIKHLYKMFYKRYKQYSEWKKLQESDV